MMKWPLSSVSNSEAGIPPLRHRPRNINIHILMNDLIDIEIPVLIDEFEMLKVRFIKTGPYGPCEFPAGVIKIKMLEAVGQRLQLKTDIILIEVEIRGYVAPAGTASGQICAGRKPGHCRQNRLRRSRLPGPAEGVREGRCITVGEKQES